MGSGNHKNSKQKQWLLLGCMFFFQPFLCFAQEGEFSANQQDIPFSSARIFSKIIEKTGFDPNADWFESFGEDNEEKAGKDLYLAILNKTGRQPAENATKNISSLYGISESELISIIAHDYTPIFKKKNNLTQEETQKKAFEIQQKYQEEKEVLILEAKVKSAVEANEIFANGDMGDSGFDLINDLQLIENLLFLKSNPTDIGKSYQGTTSQNFSESPSLGEVLGQDTNTSESSGLGEGSSSDEQSPGSQDPGQSAESANPNTVAGFDPNSCFGTDSYSEALAEFEQKQKNDESYKDNSGSTGVFSSQDSSSIQSKSEDFLPQKNTPPASAEAAKPDSWLKQQDCSGVFCLNVEYIKKPASSTFQNTDNCIACHVEKANDALKNVIDHSLIPNKVPGNLGESAKCKKAVATGFDTLSMNIYILGQPVKTPSYDTLIYDTNANNDWRAFCQTVKVFAFDACKQTESSGYEIPPSLIDVLTKRELSFASDETTLAEITQNLNRAAAQYQFDRNQELKTLKTSKLADEKIVFFHPLRIELDQMNYYFRNMHDLLESMHAKVERIPGIQACTELNNKKECE